MKNCLQCLDELVRKKQRSQKTWESQRFCNQFCSAVYQKQVLINSLEFDGIGKKCTRCEKKKSLEEFTTNPQGIGGRKSICKECRKPYGKQYYQKNMVLAKLANRENHYKRNYGMTIKERDRKWQKQEGRCSIHKERISLEEIVVDHDHKTGKVRDILCSPCNMILGIAKDNPNILQAAADYLLRHNP